MTEEPHPEPKPATEALPQALVRNGRSLSVIWLVPLVAALIGAWLVYKTLSEKGPEITITFQSAEGLDAGKTKIKYKEVDVGQVEAMTLDKDLSRVVVKAGLIKDFADYLTDKTRFWVVKPRISAGEVSGLGTLFAGAYISVDPNRQGKPAHHYTGLDRPPIVTADLPGQSFTLRADRLGSLDSGSPVYYRQIRVGEVENYQLSEDGNSVDIKIFIHSPYDRFVLKNTRFWNAGGLNFTMDANGIKVDTESLVSIVLGGIAFDTPVNLESSEPAARGDRFPLYPTHHDALQKIYAMKDYYVIQFSGSVRGLSPGAPVEFRGLRIGEVMDINLKVDAQKLEFGIPVLIEIEPESIFKSEAATDAASRQKFISLLVAKGLRAQLKTGNFITGQLYVDLDFFPNAPPSEIRWDGKYPELPSIQAPMDEIMASISTILDRAHRFPLDEVGTELRATLQGFQKAAADTRALIQAMEADVAPRAGDALKQAQNTLASFEKAVQSDAPLSLEARRALEELADAARSIRSLVEYLERNPDSLIYGKGKAKP